MRLVGDAARVVKSAELVAQALRLRIVRGELGEGDGLPPENVLMRRFKVSRPTLREAFRILESEQLITIHRGARGGGRIHAPSDEVVARFAALVLQHRGASLHDLHRARCVIEPACAGMLAASRTNRHLLALSAAIDEQRNTADPAHAQQSSATFHRLVVELAGNQTLMLVSWMIRHLFTLATEASSQPARPEGNGQAARRRLLRDRRVHEALLEHIRSRDTAAAEQLWARHLAGARWLAAAGVTDGPLVLFR